jgi:hypothetical protein
VPDAGFPSQFAVIYISGFVAGLAVQQEGTSGFLSLAGL